MRKIFYLMGKSASGKDHIYEALRKDSHLSEAIRPLILYTTRPMRVGEENGREYFFTDEAELDRLRRSGKIIEERCYQTVHGPWYYFTADNGTIDPEQNYIGIGTLESYGKMRSYFGAEVMVPLFIETEDGIRLERALQRERKQTEPKYAELCRRFLVDSEDFAEEKIQEAGITKRFFNNGELCDCIREVADYIKNMV